MKPTPKKQTGFTLIEIVIVLAIAALIMVIVFLAVAGAQRAQRDNTNKAAAGQALSQAEQFLANNSGLYPATAMPSPYLEKITSSTGTNPSSAVGAVSAFAKDSFGKITVSTKATCNASKDAIIAGGNTQAAVLWYSEGSGASQCITN